MIFGALSPWNSRHQIQKAGCDIWLWTSEFCAECGPKEETREIRALHGRHGQHYQQQEYKLLSLSVFGYQDLEIPSFSQAGRCSEHNPVQTFLERSRIKKVIGVFYKRVTIQNFVQLTFRCFAFFCPPVVLMQSGWTTRGHSVD